MSSAILYLAIVAIWACVLVPRWLHRSHDTTSETEVLIAEEAGEEVTGVSGYAESGPPGGAEDDAYADSGVADPTTYIDPALADSADAGAPAYSRVEVRYDTEVTSHYRARLEHAVRSYEAIGPAHPDRPGYAPGTGQADPPGYAPGTGQADPPGYAPGTGQADRYEAPPAARLRVPPSGPGPGRAHVLQARRRLFTMLVALAIAATACVLIGLTRWWTAVPPIGMLAMYLLLLREVARADAETLRRADARARAHVARIAREHAPAAHAQVRDPHTPAPEAIPPHPAAKIIDISARADQAGDQIYDQYADAAVRAVGD